jgi:hypothetical protein
MTDTIPALSILQPWASAIARGAKRIETRSWKTRYRGPLLIHAGKSHLYMVNPNDFPRGVDGNRWLAACEGLELRRRTNLSDRLPLGAIIAIAILVDCIETERLTQPNNDDDRRRVLTIDMQREIPLGYYTHGRYGWVLSNVRALPTPIPYRGKQGLFRVPCDVLPVEYRPKEVA